jgi:hypothetical protein
MPSSVFTVGVHGVVLARAPNGIDDLRNDDDGENARAREIIDCERCQRFLYDYEMLDFHVINLAFWV